MDQHPVAGGMAMAVIDRLEKIEVEMQERKARAAAGRRRGRLRQRQVKRAPVGQPGQSIAQRLRLGRGARLAQAQVERRQFGHDRSLDLGQVEKLDRQVGRREIGMGQGVFAHRLGGGDPEGQVDDHPGAAGERNRDAAQRGVRRPAQQQMQALPAKPAECGHPLDPLRLADREKVEKAQSQDAARTRPVMARRNRRRIHRRRAAVAAGGMRRRRSPGRTDPATKPRQRRAGGQDVTAGRKVQVHRHQPAEVGGFQPDRRGDRPAIHHGATGPARSKRRPEAKRACKSSIVIRSAPAPVASISTSAP